MFKADNQIEHNRSAKVIDLSITAKKAFQEGCDPVRFPRLERCGPPFQRRGEHIHAVPVHQLGQAGRPDLSCDLRAERNQRGGKPGAAE